MIINLVCLRYESPHIPRVHIRKRIATLAQILQVREMRMIEVLIRAFFELDGAEGPARPFVDRAFNL